MALGTNAADLLTALAEASRKEEGNLRFDVLQHTMRANHFTIIEAWQTRKLLTPMPPPHTQSNIAMASLRSRAVPWMNVYIKLWSSRGFSGNGAEARDYIRIQSGGASANSRTDRA